jgi:phosphopantetheine adenylyltransferase
MRLDEFIQSNRRIGIVLGRMSPPTLAHQGIIDHALRKYFKVYVIIVEGKGTSQLAKNFLTFQQRKDLLKITNPKALVIQASTGYLPDIIDAYGIQASVGLALVVGTDRASDYLKQFKNEKYSVIVDEIPRTAKDISATKVRQALYNNDYETYTSMIARGLDNKKWFGTLRKLLLSKMRTVSVESFCIQEIGEMMNENVNKHIEHFEDNVLINGLDGIDKNLEILDEILKILSGDAESHSMITVKWDGAPAVIFGTNPENGKFFVSTKSLFNKDPKLAYTPKDVDVNFGHAPELAKKLKVALKYLPDLGVNEIFQGDLLFTDDKKVVNIDGEPNIVFTPNTITYAVPNDNSDLAKKIRLAKIGLVVHTLYRGPSITDLTSSFSVDASKFKGSNDVWIQDAYVRDMSGVVNFTSIELKWIDVKRDKIESLSRTLNKSFFNAIDGDLLTYMKMFHNDRIKGGAIPAGQAYYTQFVEWLQTSLQGDIDSKKTDRGKAANKVVMDKIMKPVLQYRKEFITLFMLHSLFSDIKQVVIKKLNRLGNIGTFMKNGDEFKITNPEGFCIVDNTGNIMKLVDRMDFSRANFLATKEWK